MKRIITCIAILITAFAQLHAQHPRVCDYVSLKHALKGLECEVMRPASYYYNKDTVLIEHTKEEIRIGVINKYGKAIDSLNIINYKSDTVYIYGESGFYEDYFDEIKTSKGAFRIRTQANQEFFFEPLEMPDFTERELHDTIPASIYPDIFEWEGLERLIKDGDTEHTAEVWCSLTRLILDEYKLTHVDRWESRIFISSLKRDIALAKKYGRKINIPSEYEVIHVYDTISRINNDDYMTVMEEDENQLPIRWRKGSIYIILEKIYGLHKYPDNPWVLYKEPSECSDVVYKVEKSEPFIIHDIIGFWYYVESKSKRGLFGWVKLNEPPNVYYPVKD